MKSGARLAFLCALLAISLPCHAAPAPIQLHGTGQEATRRFPLESGLATFQMKYQGQSNFIVTLLDEEGNRIASLSNKIGSCDISKALNIPGSGKYLLNVQASGKWTIAIAQPRIATAPATKTLQGKGQQATQMFMLEKGLHVFRMHYAGRENFIPNLLDVEGNRVSNLANKIGGFDGSQAVKIEQSGLYLIDVLASGPWTITIE